MLHVVSVCIIKIAIMSTTMRRENVFVCTTRGDYISRGIYIEEKPDGSTHIYTHIHCKIHCISCLPNPLRTFVKVVLMSILSENEDTNDDLPFLVDGKTTIEELHVREILHVWIYLHTYSLGYFRKEICSYGRTKDY